MIPKSWDAYVQKGVLINTHMCMCCITAKRKKNFASLLCLFTMNVNVLFQLLDFIVVKVYLKKEIKTFQIILYIIKLHSIVESDLF